MQVDRIPEWALTPADEAQIVALLAQAFDTDFGGRSFFRQRHHLRLLARDGGALVGHMALLWRAVRLGGSLVTVAGLAEVATAGKRRGEGIAGRLLQVAIAEALGSSAEFLLLFGTAALYAGAGFRPAANPMLWADMTGACLGGICREPARDLMVLPLRGREWDDGAELDLLGDVF